MRCHGETDHMLRIMLTDAEERRIADVLAERAVAGSRYPAAGMATVNA